VWFVVIAGVLAMRAHSKVQKELVERKRKSKEEKYERKQLGGASASYGTNNEGFEDPE